MSFNCNASALFRRGLFEQVQIYIFQLNYLLYYSLLISTKSQRACFESCTAAIKSDLSTFTTWLQICFFRIFANVPGSGVRIIYFQAGRLGSFTIWADRQLWQHYSFFLPEAYLMHFTYHCWFLNCLHFQGPPLPMALVKDLPPSRWGAITRAIGRGGPL